MTFMRKLMDVLNMDNWKQSNTEPLPEAPIPLFPIQEENKPSINITVEPENEIVTSEEVMPLEIPSHEYVSDIFDTKQEVTPPINNNNTKCKNNIKPKTSTAAKIDRNISVPSIPYKSKRFIIKGLHLYFTDIAREIIHDRKVSYIPLMREYKLSEQELTTVIDQIAVAGIIDAEKKVLMTSQELEHFIDIYEPDLFKCEHAVFDKEIFMCIGEIIFSDGVEKVYDSLPADEVIDYLNIFEKMNLIKYNPHINQYKISSTYEDFTEICKSIPASFSSSTYADADPAEQYTDFDNMTGVEFEKFAAHILSQNNFINIKMTPASGDHGVDILAEKDNVTYAIQCKCYSSNIGNSAVQQAHTGKSLYHRDIAVVLTNQYFTQQAKDEAKELHVKLWDRDTLNNMLNKTL